MDYFAPGLTSASGEWKAVKMVTAVNEMVAEGLTAWSHCHKELIISVAKKGKTNAMA